MTAGRPTLAKLHMFSPIMSVAVEMGSAKLLDG
eukprot:CAMPEP_0181450898 /NCGR_PEP_ID=MMETSP1110-20121109/28411_1 /TAXON_ID=174948 /ORGANISM="Symbiodinium sp., Strain CCMP421" /LENGTH=32 /DNA_ID= /DNA_START= /DNA_END= /DNA_ORIENTATION=